MADEFKRYQVPTHLKVEDRLTIWLFTFTFRQLTVLMLGVGAAYVLWQQFPSGMVALLVALLGAGPGQAVAAGLQLASIALLLLLTLLLTFVRRRGRTLETWALVWLRYQAQPRCFRWQRQPDPALRAAALPVRPAAQVEEDQ